MIVIAVILMKWHFSVAATILAALVLAAWFASLLIAGFMPPKRQWSDASLLGQRVSTLVSIVMRSIIFGVTALYGALTAFAVEDHLNRSPDDVRPLMEWVWAPASMIAVLMLWGVSMWLALDLSVANSDARKEAANRATDAAVRALHQIDLPIELTSGKTRWFRDLITTLASPTPALGSAYVLPIILIGIWGQVSGSW